MNVENKVGFAIGTGRCGTLFLYQLMENEPLVASSHERNHDNETFHRYCKWHGLPVDHEGFLAVKGKEIREDLAVKAYSFEASPHLSLSVRELYERFGARFIFLVRRPDRVVTSFVHKGFYRRRYVVGDASLATGYQDQSPEKMHTFFARVAPTGDYFHKWNAMTPVGKVAWFWRAWNERTLSLLETLPQESYRIVRLEDLDYAKYLNISSFLGFNAQVTQATFDSLNESKPHAFWRKRNVHQWSEQEIGEFEDQVARMAARFGYEHRIVNLAAEAKAEREEAVRLGHIPQPPTGPQLWRLRRGTAQFLRRTASALSRFANGVDVQ